VKGALGENCSTSRQFCMIRQSKQMALFNTYDTMAGIYWISK